jgi:septin 2
MSLTLKIFILNPLGETGLGKSTLVNSLFLTDLYPERNIPSAGGWCLEFS